jgi:hypothetical protein
MREMPYPPVSGIIAGEPKLNGTQLEEPFAADEPRRTAVVNPPVNLAATDGIEDG